MDPFSAIGFANECVGICVEIAKTVKKIVEAVKHLGDDLLKIVGRAERTRNLLVIIRSIAQKLVATGRQSVQLFLDHQACREAVRKLEAFTLRIDEAYRHNKLWAGIKWWKSNSEEAAKLCAAVKQSEDDLLQTIDLTHKLVTLDSLESMDQIKDQVNVVTKLVSAFPGPDAARASIPAGTSQGRTVAIGPRTWHGVVLTGAQPVEYIENRHKLADAAYYGKFRAVEELITYGEDRWKETWANASRLGQESGLTRQSYWTPLHQAVLMNAPIQHIRWLLAHGASRLLRTRRSEYAYSDITALELARHFGYSHMYESLTPAIYHPIPQKVLQLLQEQLHSLIEREFGTMLVDDWHLRLPVLEILTEVEEGLMWFPMMGHIFSGAGFAFRLDGRDLVVMAQNIANQSDTRLFRVTTHSSAAVEEAFLVNDVVM